MLYIDRVLEEVSSHPAIYTIFLVLMAEKEMVFLLDQTRRITDCI
jgi:hypothetical protein